jgi:Holliday junction resolvase
VRAAKVDQNHPEIVAALRDIGCEVLSLAKIGKGCPDLLVYRRGKMYLLEVKHGTAKAKGKTREAQDKFAGLWPVSTVRSVEDAIRAVSA